MNTPVSFPIAKLLKEKGYNVPCLKCYLENGSLQISSGDEGDFEEYNHNQWDNYSAPIIADVVMWLYEKHDIWIHTCYMTETKNWWWDCYKYKKENGLLNEPAYSHKFNHQSPTEAYEAAIEFTLKNLIP